MEAFILRKKSSVIAPTFGVSVIYPEGSTCRCVNLNNIINAPDTSGKVIFDLNSKGIWEIQCNNSLYSTSKIIEITDDHPF
jgi:hypothetical protein